MIRTDLPHLEETEVSARIELRQKRQRLPTRSFPAPPTLEVIVSEAILWGESAATGVMRQQVWHLLKATEGWILMDFVAENGNTPPSTVYREHVTGAIYLDKPSEIDVYERVWRSPPTSQASSPYATPRTRATDQPWCYPGRMGRLRRWRKEWGVRPLERLYYAGMEINLPDNVAAWMDDRACLLGHRDGERALLWGASETMATESAQQAYRADTSRVGVCFHTLQMPCGGVTHQAVCEDVAELLEVSSSGDDSIPDLPRARPAATGLVDMLVVDS